MRERYRGPKAVWSIRGKGATHLRSASTALSIRVQPRYLGSRIPPHSETRAGTVRRFAFWLRPNWTMAARLS